MKSHKYVNPYLLAEIERMPVEVPIDPKDYAELVRELKELYRKIEEEHEAKSKKGRNI